MRFTDLASGAPLWRHQFLSDRTSVSVPGRLTAGGSRPQPQPAPRPTRCSRRPRAEVPRWGLPAQAPALTTPQPVSRHRRSLPRTTGGVAPPVISPSKQRRAPTARRGAAGSSSPAWVREQACADVALSLGAQVPLGGEARGPAGRAAWPPQLSTTDAPD